MEPTPTVDEFRRIDIAIAERVMGWQRAKESRITFDGAVAPPQDAWLCPTPLGWRVEWNDDAIPRYSTDITAAWDVWVKLVTISDDDLSLAPRWKIEEIPPAPPTPRQMIPHLVGWCVQEYAREDDEWTNIVVVEADTAPLAICRAALAVVTP